MRDYAVELSRPLIEPIARVYATNRVQRTVGFWACWHLLGGRQALLDVGWSISTLNRSRQDFRKMFGIDVAEAWPEQAEGLRPKAS